MHNAAFAALGIDAVYELWPATAAELPGLLERVRQPDVLGLNVTVPHKPAVFSLVDEVRETAQRIGAVNTVIPLDGRLIGDNTDVYGFTRSIEEAGNAPRGTGLVLGAGGASAAVLLAMSSMGLDRILLANRTRSRAEELAAALAIPGLDVIDPEEIASFIPETGMVVNATSVGWHDETTPLPADDIAALPAGAIAVDLTYRETSFLRLARQRGLQAIDGLGMLIHQGARSFELWTGVDAPVGVMRQAAIDEYRRRAS
jgi:shikimate dehydrogenase